MVLESYDRMGLPQWLVASSLRWICCLWRTCWDSNGCLAGQLFPLFNVLFKRLKIFIICKTLQKFWFNFIFLRRLTKNKSSVNERSVRNVFTITGEGWYEACSSENAYKRNTSETLLKTIYLQSLMQLRRKLVIKPHFSSKTKKVQKNQLRTNRKKIDFYHLPI